MFQFFATTTLPDDRSQITTGADNKKCFWVLHYSLVDLIHTAVSSVCSTLDAKRKRQSSAMMEQCIITQQISMHSHPIERVP
jgi:hypothetical protein